MRNVRRRKTARGFTLLELMAGAVVSIIILAAVAAAVIAVGASYESESQTKSSVESGRMAVAYLERVLRYTAYGVDPRFAIDLSIPAGSNITKDNGANNPGQSDDLAIRYRDPAWLRRGTLNAGGNTLTLEAPATFGIDVRSKALILACQGGSRWLVARAENSGGDTTAVSSVGIDPYGAPFLDNANTGLDCIQQGTAVPAFVMLMHEARFRLLDIGSRRYLVLYDRLGLDPANANTPFEILASDIEDFQVAYVMNRPGPASPFNGNTPSDGNGGNWIIGDAATDTQQVPDATANAPTYDTTYGDSSRFTRHPANVRMLRVTVIARSTSTDRKGRLAFPRLDVENHLLGGVDRTDGYYRTSITTAVRLPNMTSRGFFLPPLSAGAADDSNLWGG